MRDAVAVAALLVVVGWLDIATGYDLQFFIFYFMPVALAAWRLGRGAGLLAAALCAAIWIFADVHSGHVYSNPVFIYWNGGIRLVAFVIIAITVAKLRVTLSVEHALRTEVQNALREVKQLRGLLPICSACKRIRDHEGTWVQIEQYVRAHTEAEFTHGICPECMRTLYPGIADKLLRQPKPV